MAATAATGSCFSGLWQSGSTIALPSDIHYGKGPTGKVVDTTTYTILFFIGLTLAVIAVATVIGLVVAQSADGKGARRRSDGAPAHGGRSAQDDDRP